MANVKISQLPLTGTPSSAGLIPIVQGGTTYSATAADIAALGGGGVSSFNTRTGAVTLAGADVTGALGYTPADAATVVPDSRTITINGDTQDLSADRTFTISSGPTAVSLQGINSIAVGDFVKINENGTVGNAKPMDLTTTTYRIPPTTCGFATWGNVAPNLFATTSSPNNPDQVVNLYVDTSNTYLYGFVSNVSETSVNFETASPSSTSILSGGCLGFITQWDPFEKDVLWVLSNYYNSFYYVLKLKIGPNNSLINLNSTTLSVTPSIMVDFKLSTVTPNLMTIAYQYAGFLNAVNAVFKLSAYNNFEVALGTVLVIEGINTVQTPVTDVWDFVRISDVDEYALGYSYYDGTNYNSIVATFSSLPYLGSSIIPNIVLNDTATVYQTTEGVAYSTYKNIVCVDKNRLVYNALTFDQVTPGSFYLPSFKVVSLSGTTIGTIGTEFVYNGVIRGITHPNKLYTLPVNKNYLLFFGINDTLGYSGGFWAATMKVNTDNTISLLNINFNLGGSGGVLAQFSTLATFNSSNNGTAFLNVMFANGSNNFTLQTSPIVYIDKQFTNQNLLGTATTAISLPATPVIGESYGGGIVGYILQEGDAGYDPNAIKGLIVANVDQTVEGSSSQWYNGSDILTGASGTAIGTGLSNSNLIISTQGPVSTDYAAGIAEAYTGGGFNDWYLPSKDEIAALYNTVGPGANSIANLSINYAYWTSSEFDTTTVYTYGFYNGGTSALTSKASYVNMVRAIRSFTFTPTSATVNVIPFSGSVETKTGVVAGNTYYIQDDAALTTNVTPSLYGTAITSSSVKTINYPTI